MKGILFFGLLVLAACAASPGQDPIPYALDSEGIALKDSNLRIDFGRTKESTLLSMSKLEGSEPVDQGNCGLTESFATWPSGVSLIFVNDTFSQWRASGENACNTV